MVEATVDIGSPFCLHRRVKWLALTAILFLECSCTTLVTRRDLYSPDPAPDSYEYQKRWTNTTTTTTTTTTTEQEPPLGPVIR